MQFSTPLAALTMDTDQFNTFLGVPPSTPKKSYSHFDGIDYHIGYDIELGIFPQNLMDAFCADDYKTPSRPIVNVYEEKRKGDILRSGAFLDVPEKDFTIVKSVESVKSVKRNLMDTMDKK